MEFIYDLFTAARSGRPLGRFHLGQCPRRPSRRAKEMGWNVPGREWTYFVLPTRINSRPRLSVWCFTMR